MYIGYLLQEAAEYGVDFDGPIDLNPEEDIVVPALYALPANIVQRVNELSNLGSDNVFEVDTFTAVKDYIHFQIGH